MASKQAEGHDVGLRRAANGASCQGQEVVAQENQVLAPRRLRQCDVRCGELGVGVGPSKSGPLQG